MVCKVQGRKLTKQEIRYKVSKIQNSSIVSQSIGLLKKLYEIINVA